MVDYVAGWHWLDLIVASTLVFFIAAHLWMRFKNDFALQKFLMPLALILIAFEIYWLNPSYNSFMIAVFTSVTMATEIVFLILRKAYQEKTRPRRFIYTIGEAILVLLVAIPLITNLFLAPMLQTEPLSYIGALVWAAGQILFAITLWRNESVQASRLTLVIAWGGITMIATTGIANIDIAIIMSFAVLAVWFLYFVFTKRKNIIY